jgi:predicted SAM-dependent methyltransferase
MKLHIGARTRAEGWKTLDINPGPEVDFVGNCSDLSQFTDASIDAIYASHVLEHLRYDQELPGALGEWFRVLRPGGDVMISVPDLETLCHLFIRPNISQKDQFHVMRMMFGGHTSPYDFHYVGLTWRFLAQYLRVAGFQDITRVERFGVFNDTSMLMFGGVPISLNVKAIKP